MSSDRVRRFEHLERPRREGPDGDERPPAAKRFDHLDEAGAVPGSAVPDSARDRFGAPRERGPELERTGGDEQPFLRCMRCEADNSRYARTCANCGEELHTPAQRAFNEKLWAARRAEREEMERAGAERRAAMRAAEEEAARARREAAEVMAEAAAEQERRRLAAGGAIDPDGADADPRPYAMRLLGLLPPRWRIGVIAALIAALVGITAWSYAARNPFFLLLVTMLVTILFARPGRWRRRLGRWGSGGGGGPWGW